MVHFCTFQAYKRYIFVPSQNAYKPLCHKGSRHFGREKLLYIYINFASQPWVPSYPVISVLVF